MRHPVVCIKAGPYLLGTTKEKLLDLSVNLLPTMHRCAHVFSLGFTKFFFRRVSSLFPAFSQPCGSVLSPPELNFFISNPEYQHAARMKVERCEAGHSL